MIGIIFDFAGEVVEVRVDGNTCLFRTKDYGGAFFPIERLRLDKKGVIKEFPDLKDRDDWRIEAIKRFKKKLKKMKTEEEKINYVKDDLKKVGYIPLHIQRQGRRPEKIS